jgi:MFS family permease
VSEIDEIRNSLRTERLALREPLFRRRYRRPILLAVAIAAFNQLSGINAVMYYAPRIFMMAGSGTSSALLQTVAVGGTNLVLTMAALELIDRIGRRKLMLAGSVGYIVSLGVTAWAFFHYGSTFTETGGAIVLAGLLVFIASHAFGQGAVIWVFLGEIFPTAVRARGQAWGAQSTGSWRPPYPGPSR